MPRKTIADVYNGGLALVQALHAEGVKYVYSIPGGEFITFLEALDRWGKDKGMTYIGVRHEQGAAHMADAFARVSGKVGVVAGTLGPGIANIVPGVCTAHMDNIRLLVINPSQDPKFEDHHRLQSGIDQLGLLKPVVKYQKHVTDPNRIFWGTQKCFKELYSGRPNPVHLQIREDAFHGEVEEYGQKVLQPSQYRAVEGPAGNPKLIAEAVELILNAKKPVIVSGGGVTASESWDLLRKLSIDYNIPAVTTVMGIGTISTESETFIGTSLSNGGAMKVVKEADTVIAFGCKFSYTMGYGKAPVWNPDAKLIQVDLDPQMIGKNRPVDIGILGDCKVVLDQLYTALQEKSKDKLPTAEWLAELKASRQLGIDMDKPKYNSIKTPIHPYRLIKDLMEFMEPEDILSIDGGDIAVMTISLIDYFKPRAPRTVLYPIAFGHLGTGIPFAIGAKCAAPDKRVFMITGDGSFLFNIQELDTAVRYDIPFVGIVADNCSWGMIKNNEMSKFGKKHASFCVDIESDYVKIAEGFGCYAERVEDPNEIKAALQRAVDSKKPAILVVPIKFFAPPGTKIMASFRQLKF
jgi:acetolactate synthase I/II/III large subunit